MLSSVMQIVIHRILTTIDFWIFTSHLQWRDGEPLERIFQWKDTLYLLDD